MITAIVTRLAKEGAMVFRSIQSSHDTADAGAASIQESVTSDDEPKRPDNFLLCFCGQEGPKRPSFMWTSVPPGDNTLSNLSCFHQLFPSSTARLTLEPMMQLLTAVVWALAACQVASETLPFFGSQQTLHGIDDKLDVPGDSPLQYCRQSDDDILVIEHVNLSPNPPVPGQNLSIEAAGIFKKDVEEGAYVNLQVKYGLIRLVNTKADLCSQVEQVDLKCPIKKGETLLTKTVEIPKEVPPGKYTVLADVYTVDDEKITCLTAEVTFPRGS